MISLFNSVLKGKNGNANKAPMPRQVSGSFSVKGSLQSAAKLKSELSTMSMFSGLSEENGIVNAMVVESTDRKKNPYMFIKLSFRADGLEAFYSIPPEVPNPEIRKLDVMRSIFTISSLLEKKGAFLPDREDLYGKMAEAFSIVKNFADHDSLKMKFELDSLRKDNTALKIELSNLKEEKEGLNHQLVELEKKCTHFDERVRQLESLTDRELDREIVKWVEEHDGKLDEVRFCGSLGIQGSRLEERLDSLSRNGVIRFV